MEEDDFYYAPLFPFLGRRGLRFMVGGTEEEIEGGGEGETG